MQSFRLLLVSVFAVVTLVATAAEPNPSQTSLSTTVAVPEGSKIFGAFEMRPTWISKGKDAFEARDSAELGYQFSPNTKISYWQALNHNLYNASGYGKWDVATPDGYFKLEFNKIWNSADVTYLDFQPRFHLPTSKLSRDLGKVVEIRNQFNVTHKFGSRFTLETAIIPTILIHNKAGGKNALGVEEANAVFQNRLELTPKFKLTKSLSLNTPLKFYNTRYGNFAAKALHNDQWAHSLSFNPELVYAWNKNFSTGIAYETGNLVKENLSGFNFSDGFNASVTQLILKASL